MFERFCNWWLCIGEPTVLHKTKIEFFKKAKEAKIKHTNLLWDLVKTLYPGSLDGAEIDTIIASVQRRTS